MIHRTLTSGAGQIHTAPDLGHKSMRGALPSTYPQTGRTRQGKGRPGPSRAHQDARCRLVLLRSCRYYVPGSLYGVWCHLDRIGFSSINPSTMDWSSGN